ncbi:hypothetical protein E4U45_000387 [Claviceps purpurea]|nr:hypothetical protein E4U45_000387 [Claviceps purpurea]
MHQTALRAFRTSTSYFSAVRNLPRTSRALRRGTGPLASHSTTVAHEPLRSSMYFRRLPVTLVSGIAVGYGAWYSYNLASSTSAQSVAHSFASPLTQGVDALPALNALVVGLDELQQGTVVGKVPISKPTADGGRNVEMLNSDQATEKLRRMEQSFSVNRGQGVTRYDLVQLPSNDPIEDDHAEKIVVVPGRSASAEGAQSDWMFWGVFDGHSGWTTSATLRECLISYVARELNETYKSAKTNSPPNEAIDLAIKTAFNRLDHEIVHKSVEKVFKASSKTVAAELLQPALSGSCALLSFYDSRSNLLRVACTGDSRAVLGRRSDSGKWTATALSEDQTGGSPAEAARMRKEHPGEEHVVRNGRVLGGLEPSRAFGDAFYKWSREVSSKLRKNFFGRTPSPLLKTPPYVTAEPVVTTTKVNPSNGDFLVLATDGLWEMLTNEEVVGLVGQWIETQAATATSSSASPFEAAWSKMVGSISKNKALPVEQAEPSASSSSQDGQRVPIRLQQWGIDPMAKNRFTIKDSNAATHLVRNALGGADDEQVRSLLTLPAPFARRYRDDLTVQVIFFGDGPITGQVTINLDATAPGVKPKPKI